MKRKIQSISEEWSKIARSGEWEQILQDKNSYVNIDNSYKRFQKIVEKILSENVQTKILDIGCGTCIIWKALLKYCPIENLYGIDLAEGMIEIAKKNFPKAHLFIGDVTDINKLIPSNIKFSTVISRGIIINHVGMGYFERILKRIKEYTEVNGRIIFDFLNQEWFKDKIEVPNKPFYNEKDIKKMLLRLNFSKINFYDRSSRDPVVVVEL